MPLSVKARKLSDLQLSRAAAQARARGKYQKALRLYSGLFERNPDSCEAQQRVASLQARTKATKQAWENFRLAAEAFARKGFTDKAIGVYREAAHRLPQEPEVWIAIAEIHLLESRSSDAVSTLLEGRSRMKSRRYRAEAIRLLTRVREIDPKHFQGSFDLSQLLWKAGARTGSLDLLRELEATASRIQMLRIQRERFLRSPGLRTGWVWLRAAL